MLWVVMMVALTYLITEQYNHLSNEWTDPPCVSTSHDCVGVTVITLQHQTSPVSYYQGQDSSQHTSKQQLSNQIPCSIASK